MTPRRSTSWTRAVVVCALVMFGVPAGVAAESGHVAPDSRVRTVIYSTDEIYRLHGFVGYDLEIEFASDETFTGIGGGDLDALSYGSYGNTFTVKPRATNVHTNLTVLTNKRRYLFDYVVSRGLPDPAAEDVIYLLRFAYAPDAKAQASSSEQIEAALTAGAAQRKRNYDYWYCGPPSIKPVGASDDGVHTRLQFAARAELPAVFVRNDDGTESLLNFSVDQGDVVIHRVTRQLILRRGRLAGCVVNQAFDGGGERLSSGTLSPQVHRDTQAPHP